MIWKLLRPAIFALDAERAHRLTINGLKSLPLANCHPGDSRLAIPLAGLQFATPLGMAAGFDKNGEVVRALFALGFGHSEIGSVTPRPQAGNPRPRLFRLEQDHAVINRMGFNNDGAAKLAWRIGMVRKGAALPGMLGINIGANKDSDDRIADYAKMTQIMAPLADYLTVNISSPNTPGLRALQDPKALEQLLDTVLEARQKLAVAPPIFLKLAPDLEPADIEDIAVLSLEKGLDALIISNTSIGRPKTLQSRHRDQTGGLSGRPIKALSLERLKDFRRATGGKIPLISVGGIEHADDVWQRLRAGASLCQLYSAMVYAGPELAKNINADLLARLEREKISQISDIIGLDA